MEEVIASELLELPDDEVERIVRRYFDDAEWQSLSELAKLRHIRMYVNYVGNPEFAALLPKPDFLKNVSKAAVPLSEKVKRKVTKVTKSAKSEGEVSFKSRKCDDTLKKSYPKRSSAPKVNYFEDEIADDDRYIFCDECQVEVVDFCDKCGMLVTIEDVKVPMGVPDRARKTVPEALEIKPSPVHGLGVFATKTVPKGVQLGPYEGKLTKVENTMGYSWKLRNGRLVDAGDESISNWTRYVNCADHMSRQNLVAFQYKGNLYYRTARTINAGEELLVFYGKSFAEKLGVDVKSYFNPQCEELKKDFYPCEFCGVGLCSQKYRAMHQKYCMKGRICLDSFACQFCKCCFMTETHRNHHQRKCVKVPTKDNTKRSRAIKGDACTKCKLTTKYTPDIKANKFQCHLCNFETRYKFNLTVHARRHDNTFGFVCPCCKKIFKQKLHLDSHYISNHKDQMIEVSNLVTSKIHRCDHCHYKTVLKTNLTNHVRTIHRSTTDTNENLKEFHCSVCSFKTINKTSLKRHMNIHNDAVGFVCKYCKKLVKEKKQIDGHYISKHKDKISEFKDAITNKVHQCSQCSYQSVLLNNLKVHVVRRHHKKQTTTDT